MCFFSSPSEAMLSLPAVLYGILVEQMWKKVWIGKSSTALSDLISPFANCAFASFLVIPFYLSQLQRLLPLLHLIPHRTGEESCLQIYRVSTMECHLPMRFRTRQWWAC